MYVSDILNHLFYGELSNTVIGKGSSLSVTYYPKLISFINLGVQALYERYALRESEVVIQMYEAITEYYLQWNYAYTNESSTAVYQYIIDSVSHPFNEDKKLKVLNIYDEGGYEYDINPVHIDTRLIHEKIAYTPQHDLIQIPYPIDENSLFVMCQCAPNDVSISLTVETAATTEIEIPTFLVTPLLTYVAERYFISMAGSKDETALYPSKFELACQRLERAGLVPKDAPGSSNKFYTDGWV